MRIAIIDDEKSFCHILKKELNSHFSNAEICCYQDIDEQIYQNINTCDIIFLDVMLENRQSFKAGEQLLINNPSILIVYMSNIDHFVYDSYEQRTFFFLRKSHLQDSLNKFIKKYSYLENENMQSLTIQFNKQEYKILQKDIICIESFRNQIIVQTIKAQYTLYKPLKRMFDELNHNYFYRLNRYTIINLAHVITYSSEEIQSTNDIKIIFTRGSKVKFEKVYLTYRSTQLWN